MIYRGSNWTFRKLQQEVITSSKKIPHPQSLAFSQTRQQSVFLQPGLNGFRFKKEK